MNIGNSTIIIGVVLILIGLVYKLGYNSFIYFKYSFEIGFMLFGIGILIDGIEKMKKKKNI
ncbi:hypothetical protein GY31_04675 [Lysinibacillus sphaericus]|uniref:Uncharacterized protein n=1 Tax=Lysinibacillus sphaericus TaxID=1421 RepID=A0A2S5CWM8_LYSSH|nr:hypothetical protein [Lysinibacillus sphaericus]OEC03008.1 hypothetical protein GY31_04675 [Lysinibacillus sphaericus]POZ55158.1 hypothetical protein LYSIN_03455 [Lysinibacillus sphaericus]